MKTIYSSLLGFPAVWFLSALLHTIDPDINGISGLAELNIFFSVTIWGLFLYLPVLIPLIALRSRGIRAYWIGLLTVSCTIGAVIATVGSKATNVQEWLVSLAGVTLVCTAAFLIATIPSVLSQRRSL